MSKPSPKKITETFDAAEDEFGDHRSTEFLAAITADRLGISRDAVMSGLHRQAVLDATASE